MNRLGFDTHFLNPVPSNKAALFSALLKILPNGLPSDKIATTIVIGLGNDVMSLNIYLGSCLNIITVIRKKYLEAASLDKYIIDDLMNRYTIRLEPNHLRRLAQVG